LDPTRTAVHEEVDAHTARLPELSVEQFASYLAEIKAYPERVALVRERYGIANDAVHAALDATWQRNRSAGGQRNRSVGQRNRSSDGARGAGKTHRAACASPFFFC
jgi:hypothetical protein